VVASDIDIGTAPYRRLKPGPGRSAADVTSHQRARIDRAMVEIVVERGYDRVTVREIARVAGVSTRAFYEHYSGKEECFLCVHRDLARRLLRRIEVPAGAASDGGQLRTAVDAIIGWWGLDQEAARFLFVGPFGAGSTALKQSRLVDQSLGRRIGRRLDPSAEKGGETTGLIAGGIAVGLGAVMRSTALNDGDVRSPDLHRALTQWALSCACSRSELAALQGAQARVEQKSSSGQALSSGAAGQPSSPGDDLTLLYSATVKLAGTGDHGSLTPRRICAAAGVSRRSFDVNFPDIDGCLVAAAIQQIDLAIEHVQRVDERGAAPTSTALRHLAGLCGRVACDPALAHLCFGDTVQSSEWQARRDQLLMGRIAGMFESAGLATFSVEQPKAQASLGAILGLLQNEVAAGRAGCVDRKTPALAYLMLAPTVGKSSAMEAICEA